MVAEPALDSGVTGNINPDRRTLTDRRALSWWSFVYGSIHPRRRGHRRHHESDTLVDWHEPHLMFLAVTILLLSITDASLTLSLLSRGARELNPIMAFFIEDTPQLFVTVKMALTGGGIVVLVALARARVFRVIRISHIIHWSLLGYIALIAYEAWLLLAPV